MSDIIRSPSSSPFTETDDSTNARPQLRLTKGKKTLDRWIAERLSDLDKDGALSHLALEHVAGNMSSQVLHTKRVGNQDQNPKEIAALLIDVAQTFCQDLTNVHYFRVLAFYSGSEQSEGVYNFALNGRQDFDSMMASEGPNKEGLLSQGMNWSHRALSLALTQTAVCLEANNKTVQMLVQNNANLMEENHKAYEVLKGLMLEKALAENNNELAKEKYKRDSEERKKFIGMIPPLANQITGHPIFPQTTEDSSIVEQLADLDEDDLVKITSVLQKKPILLAALASRFNQIADKNIVPNNTAEEKALAKVDGESDFETVIVRREQPPSQPDEDKSSPAPTTRTYRGEPYE